MDKSVPGVFWGALLVLAGLFWLLSNLFEFQIDFGMLWPAFLLIPGLILWSSYLFGGDKADVGVLIPANILLFLSVTFFFNTFASVVLGYSQAWVLTVAMYSTGPVAIAFWITWFASGRKAGYLIPAVILTIISICIASVTVPIALFNTPIFAEVTRIGWPLLLILIGLMVVFGPIWAKAFTPDGESGEKKKPQAGPDIEEAEIVEEKTTKVKDDEKKSVDEPAEKSVDPEESKDEKKDDDPLPELNSAEKVVDADSTEDNSETVKES